MAHSQIFEAPQDPFAWLQGWYASHCDGDWEHDERIRIETLDNPGWRVRIGLTGTALETRQLERVRVERDEHDWIHAWVENGSYRAACGPTNLREALLRFREWASS